jgi:hypothetical protein
MTDHLFAFPFGWEESPFSRLIPKLRNQGFMRLGIGFALLVLAVLVAALLDRTALRNLGYGSAVLMGVVGTLYYYFGLADLLKAKGYSGAIVIAIVVLGFCVPLVSAFIMTPVVLFALEDKNRRYRRHESHRRAATDAVPR